MRRFTIYLLLTSILYSCSDTHQISEKPSFLIKSPNGKNSMEFFLLNNDEPGYFIKNEDEVIIDTSRIAIEIKDMNPLEEGFRIEAVNISQFDGTWEMPWGEQRMVRDLGFEMAVELIEANNPHRQFNLFFRAYDDGVAFRYEIKEIEGVDSLIVLNERTEFQLSGDHTCWWIPGDWDIYEHLYHTTKFSEIDALSDRDHPNARESIRTSLRHPAFRTLAQEVIDTA